MHDEVKRRIIRAGGAGLVPGVMLTALLVLAPLSLGAAPSDTSTSEPAPTETASPATAAESTVAASAGPRAIVSGSTAGNGVPAGPQLSIAVDNGHTSATVGDALTYTITIVNLGTTDIPGLVLTQTLPTGLTFGSADAGGTAQSDSVTWNVDLKATETSTFHTTMSVAATPADLLRLATVACASRSPGGSPIVCASDSDQLPAGAAAESSQAAASAAADTAAANPAGTGLSWWWIGAAIGLVVVAALAMGIILKRRSASSVDHHGEQQEVQADHQSESESETEPNEQDQEQPDEPDEPDEQTGLAEDRPAPADMR